MTDTPPYRLPRTIEPDRYEIEIVPDLDRATFTGTERVSLQIHEPTGELVLNAAELEVAQARLVCQDGAQLDASVAFNEDEERVILRLEGEAPAGPATLLLSFAGSINDKLRGLYRSTYQDADGDERVIAATQFEATDARRAFPCWDEPDRKAVFSITLSVGPGLTAVS